MGGIQANETEGSGKGGDMLFLFVQRIGQGVDGADMEEVGTRWPYKAARAWLRSSAVESIGTFFIHSSHALRDMAGLVISVTARLTRASIDGLFTDLSAEKTKPKDGHSASGRCAVRDVDVMLET